MKKLEMIILLSLFFFLNCEKCNKIDRDYSLKNREITSVSTLLSSQKSFYEIIEEIRIICEKEIPEIKSASIELKNYDKYVKQIIYHIDSIKKTTKNTVEMISKINQYIFDDLEIVPVPDRENLLYLFPQFVVTEKKGNCIGLSLLYFLIGEEVNIPFNCIIVPEHVFVLYDDGIKRINIETLKKGEQKSDDWYLEKYNKKGMESYILKKINKREIIGIIFYNIGTNLMLRKRYNVSLEYLKIADNLLLSNPEVEGNLALAYDGVGESDSALKILIELRKRYPEFENIEKNIGVLQLKCKKYREAVSTYSNLCKKEPLVGENYYGLALSYYYTGKMDMSLFYLEKALELKPDYREAYFLLNKINSK